MEAPQTDWLVVGLAIAAAIGVVVFIGETFGFTDTFINSFAK